MVRVIGVWGIKPVILNAEIQSGPALKGLITPVPWSRVYINIIPSCKTASQHNAIAEPFSTLVFIDWLYTKRTSLFRNFQRQIQLFTVENDGPQTCTWDYFFSFTHPGWFNIDRMFPLTHWQVDSSFIVFSLFHPNLCSGDKKATLFPCLYNLLSTDQECACCPRKQRRHKPALAMQIIVRALFLCDVTTKV